MSIRRAITTTCAVFAVAICSLAPGDNGYAIEAGAPTGVAAAGAPAGEALTGLEVAKRMDEARRSKTEHNVMTMTLENARGQKRVRTIEGWSREVSEEEDHRFAKFMEPADVKDTTLLTYDFDEADDDIWLYLPALKKVKRILSSNKTDYFMGSDFSYWDMENVDLVNWDYQLTGTEPCDGTECYVVKATPKNAKEIEESGYDNVVYWVGKNDSLARKIEYTDQKKRLGKRLTLSEIRPTSPTDPRPRAHKLYMENLLTNHKTTLDMSKLELDVAVDDDLFSQRNMMP